MNVEDRTMLVNRQPSPTGNWHLFLRAGKAFCQTVIDIVWVSKYRLREIVVLECIIGQINKNILECVDLSPFKQVLQETSDLRLKIINLKLGIKENNVP